MSLGFCLFVGLFCGFILTIIGFAIVDIHNTDWGLIPVIAGILLIITGVLGCCVYGIADEKIEEVLHVPIVSINGVQFIQYDNPNTGDPIIINVNERFKRNFVEGECISVTIYSEGPYHGVYCRPNSMVEVCEEPMCQPPTFIPPPLEYKGPLCPKCIDDLSC